MSRRINNRQLEGIEGAFLSEYTFTHSLTQSVSYESVLLSRRRALHARLVDEIERLYAGRLAEQVERLAQHALRGEVWERAVTYCREAGVKAARRSASREASGHFEQALGALRRLPESREHSELAVDLIVELGRALHPIGEHQRCLDLFREASALAEAWATGGGSHGRRRWRRGRCSSWAGTRRRSTPDSRRSTRPRRWATWRPRPRLAR